VYEYMNYLVKIKKNGASARSRKTASLRSFFKYLTIKLKILEENPIKELETPKLKKSLPKFLSLDESKKFLETIKNFNSERVQRDYAIATLFLNCGIRLSELANINFKDISPYDNSLRIVGKGNKERIIYLNKACLSAIENYKLVRGEAKDKDAVFLSRNKKRISIKTIQFLMKKYFNLAGFSHKKLSTHKLRHTAATLMYQYGKVDIMVLKDILGHENISLTQIYTHTSSEQLKSAFENNPLCSLK
ncbi:MAG: tyrosine-type recombinase/integrase, partial [Firmicutes bacterium]|nr:tyrosine-type recombinase/integrase [Bacillota bacterium]